jgi:hypothetical protein
MLESDLPVCLCQLFQAVGKGAASDYENSFVLAPPGGFEERRIAEALDLLLKEPPTS